MMSTNSIQTGSGLSHNLEIDVENDGNLDIVGSEDDLKLEDVNFFDEDSGDKNVQNEQQPKLVDETEQPLKPIEKVTFDLETITFAFGVNDRSRHRQYYDHNRENLIKLYGDLKPLSAPGGVIGGLVTQLKDLANDRRTDPEDVEAANELIGMIQREVDTARTMFENGNYARPGNDPYKMIRTVMRIVNLGTEALELLGDDTTLMSLSEGCRENLDGGSVADAEHKTQVISEDMGGRVLVGQRLDPQDQIIYQSVLTGGGQTEMSQMYGGQLGGRHYNELRRRIGDQDVVDRLTGKTKPDPEIEGLEDNPGNNNNLIIEIGGGNNRDSISNDD